MLPTSILTSFLFSFTVYYRCLYSMCIFLKYQENEFDEIIIIIKAPKTSFILNFGAFIIWYARRDSNPQPSEPEADKNRLFAK